MLKIYLSPKFQNFGVTRLFLIEFQSLQFSKRFLYCSRKLYTPFLILFLKGSIKYANGNFFFFLKKKHETPTSQIR
jgi:hypothetical protein